MGAIVAAVASVIGVVIVAVAGYFSEPTRYMDRLKGLNALLQDTQDGITRIYLERSIEMDTVRLAGRIAGEVKRRHSWAGLLSSLLGLGFSMYLAFVPYALADASDKQDTLIVVGQGVGVTFYLFSYCMLLYFANRLIIGEDVSSLVEHDSMVARIEKELREKPGEGEVLEAQLSTNPELSDRSQSSESEL